MRKIITLIIVIALAAGAWWVFSQTSDTATPSSETVTEPLNDARNLEEKATSPSRGAISE